MTTTLLLALPLLLGLQSTGPAKDVPRARSVAVLVYEGAELLDFAGPAEVLSHAGRMVRVGDRPALDVFTVATTRRPVRTQNGVSIAPDVLLAECEGADVLVVPGGANDALMGDAAAMAELGRIAAGAEVRMSVCTGAYVLGALGLLDGREVTTHAGVLDGLRRRHPTARVVEGVRFVDAGSVLTCAGVSAGIDGALHLVARLLGEDLARHTAEFMEYPYPWPEAQERERVDHGSHSVDPALSRAERLYLGAIEQVHEGDLAEATRWLRGSIEAGLEGPDRILSDPALAPIRNDEPSRRELTRLLVEAGVVGAAPRSCEPIVGLPCEGCEAVFDGLPAVLGSRARIAPGGEPGEPMVLEGTVVDPAGQPAPGVIVYAYHTDASGEYPPGDEALGDAARRHGRLRGWVATDENGRYRFDTIRPASYPGGATAAHVHMHVIEVGLCTYYVDTLRFADDPLLRMATAEDPTPARGGSGLARPRRDEGGSWVVVRDIRLGEGVPGHPAAGPHGE